MAYGSVKVDSIVSSTKTLAVDDIAETGDLGTAAAEDVGTSAGNVVQLDNSARLPAVDGSQLTGLSSGVTNLTYDAASREVRSSTGTDAVLPEATTTVAGLMSGSDKTKLNGIEAGAEVNVQSDWNAGSGDAQILNKPTLGTAAALNVGTGANNVVQLDGSAKLPAVDGSALTGLPSGTTNLSYDASTRVLASSTGDDATLPLVSTSSAGLAPATGTPVGNYLKDDGTWSSVSAAPGGSDTQIQFNDGGAFGGDVDLTYNKSTNKLTTKGDVELNDGGTHTTTLQVVTPTAARTISFPDATGTVALVAGSTGQVIYNNAGVQAGVSTMTFDGTTVTMTGRLVNSLNGALSATGIAGVPLALTGTWIATGGTATTTKPQFLIEPANAISTAWSTTGTGFGINAASGFAGRLLDLQLNGTPRWHVSAAGLVVGTQPAPAAVNTTATLSIANIQTGLITSTTAAAVDMTLPTGTLMDGGFTGSFNDMAIEWSVINTGPSAATLLAGASHTIVGSAVVAAGTSGRFTSRRTAATTWVSYRIS
jgi:hypothetical protein